MRPLLNGLYKAGGLLGAFFILAIAVLVVAQVSLNLIDRIAGVLFDSAIGLTIPSYADFTGFFLAAASFLALAYTLREGGHIRVTLVLQQLPKRVQHFAELWCIAVVAAISIYATYYTASLVHEAWTYNDMSSGMVAVPIWIPQSSVLIGLFILSVALLDELYCVLTGGDASYEGKGENLLEEIEEGQG